MRQTKSILNLGKFCQTQSRGFSVDLARLAGKPASKPQPLNLETRSEMMHQIDEKHNYRRVKDQFGLEFLRKHR